MRRREFIATVGGAGCSFSLGIARARLHRGTDRSLQNRLPAIAPFSEFVEEGGLLSYGATFARMFHDAAAHYVDRILRGLLIYRLSNPQNLNFASTSDCKSTRVDDPTSRARYCGPDNRMSRPISDLARRAWRVTDADS
jgi:hypothetical protein